MPWYQADCDVCETVRAPNPTAPPRIDPSYRDRVSPAKFAETVAYVRNQTKFYREAEEARVRGEEAGRNVEEMERERRSFAEWMYDVREIPGVKWRKLKRKMADKEGERGKCAVM